MAGGLLVWLQILARAVLGSTIERVLRQGDRPILTVKAESLADYGRVLVAVDFSIYSRRALEFATQLVANGEFVHPRSDGGGACCSAASPSACCADRDATFWR